MCSAIILLIETVIFRNARLIEINQNYWNYSVYVDTLDDNEEHEAKTVDNY